MIVGSGNGPIFAAAKRKKANTIFDILKKTRREERPSRVIKNADFQLDILDNQGV